MRLLKECLLCEVPEGKECQIDGSWYLVHHHGISSTYVELKSEYFKPEDEVYYLEIGDTQYYRNDPVVITEVPD